MRQGIEGRRVLNCGLFSSFPDLTVEQKQAALCPREAGRGFFLQSVNSPREDLNINL